MGWRTETNLKFCGKGVYEKDDGANIKLDRFQQFC
jgi:hypothetical protein